MTKMNRDKSFQVLVLSSVHFWSFMIIDLNIKCILHNKNYFCKGNVIIFLEVIEKEDPYPLSEN